MEGDRLMPEAEGYKKISRPFERERILLRMKLSSAKDREIQGLFNHLENYWLTKRMSS
jgi:hypothetical protein